MKRIKSSQERRTIFEGIRRIVIACCIFVLFFKGVVVDAGMNDSRLEKNRIDGIYAVSNISGQDRIFYLNMYTLNGVPSYCIELGVEITTDIYHSTDDFGLSTLSNEAIEYVRSISYFGYGYPGHTSYQYYMAAQELIWEYVSGVAIEWTNELSVDGARISIESYKDEILMLRKKYYEGLNLRFQNGRIYRIGDKLVIYDYSDLLSSYEIKSSGHSNAWIEGNTLQIEVSKNYVGEERIILKRKDDYSFSSKLYYYDSSQRLISAGNFLEKEEEIYFYIQGGAVTFQLVDGETGDSIPSGQASFEGTVYEFYDENGNFYENLIFQENGKSFIDNLAYGNYMIRQVNSGKGYLLDDSWISLVFDENQSYYLLEQWPISQEIEILKMYDYQGLGKEIPEENISFSIYDMEDNFYTNIITDKNGLASVVLSYGEYRFHQDNTSFGYEKVDDFVVFIDDVGKKRYNLVNPFIECQLKVTVKDKEFSNVNLGEGFQYKVWDVQKEKYLEDENGQDIFVTNKDGDLLIPVFVGYGEYRIEQVGVSEGYQDKDFQVDISLDEYSEFMISDEGILQFEVEFFQELEVGSVQIQTEEEKFVPFENGYKYEFERRANVSVDLVANEDIVVYENILYHKGDVIQAVITDEEGVASISELYFGKYCLKETDSEIQECFDFEDSLDVSVLLKLLLKKMDIVFVNKGEDDEFIKGSIVEVKEEDGKVIYKGITNDDGNFQVPNLPNGKYCFSQEKVDSHYSIYSEDICLEIDDSKEIWEVFMVNELAPKKWIVVPNTFYDGTDLKKLFLLIIIGIGVISYKKKIFSNSVFR